MKKSFLLFLFFYLMLFTSCNRQIKSSMGGSTDVVLNKNSDEYVIKRLNPVELEGNALFGIPGFGTNNRNKNKTGIIFKLNGFSIGRIPRIFPILTMVSITSFTGVVIQSLGGYKTFNQSIGGFNWVQYGEPNIPFGLAFVAAIPISGIINNSIWHGNATSGLTNQVNYRLVDENPDVDIFTNPKYKIYYKHGIFNQKASIKADVLGATLKLD